MGGGETVAARLEGGMKIALYIEEGLEQIVLTPETDTEKGILRKLHDDDRTLSVYAGSFYVCQGGWTRFEHHPGFVKDDQSTMIVLHKKEG